MVDSMEWMGAKGLSESAVKKDWYLDGKIAGTYASDRRLQHIVMKDASHMAPFDRGDSALDMFNRLVGAETSGVLVESGQPLPKNVAKPDKATHGCVSGF
jgi:carboxypeptidase C (cathepsin A)